ncbi:cathepsin D-like [Euwallacea fornicatus]|uniref:cathepsin D-like n=1 Tax=Euwallacea fornicatus TaxID=995702 RepID=UPI00338D45E9
MSWKYALLFVTCLFYFTCGSAAEEETTDEPTNGITIHLKRQPKTSFEQHINNARKLSQYGLHFDWVYKKHHHANRTNDSVILYRYFDNEFYGTIVVGHPGQTLNVAFATDWTYSWVLSSRCNRFDLAHVGCWFHKTYNHDKSSEYKPDGKSVVLPEGKYNLTGFFSFDNVSIAHSKINNFSFVEMTQVPYTMLFNKIDGVFGLGLKNENYEPFFYALMRQGKIKENIFCVYLNRDTQSNHGGNIILGFIEKRHIHSTKDSNNKTVYDPIKYMPIKPGYLWQFDLDLIYVNQQTDTPINFCNGASCTAVTDTSSNNIIGPNEAVDKIHDVIKATPFFLNRYRVDCENINKLPEIGFTIGGQNFTLKGRDYTAKMSYASITLCLSTFVPHNYTNFWVLGGSFLSEYYTIYNIKDKTIGIVKAA